jgi:hypothetical protein
MLANINTKQAALLDAATLTWRVVTLFGKNDNNDEEGWTLLPDGTVAEWLGLHHGTLQATLTFSCGRNKR